MTSSERWHVDSGPYRDAVSLPDGGPHGQRGWGYTADAVQQREARACTCGAGHLTGEHREAAQGKAAWTHARTPGNMSFQINMSTSIIPSRIFVGKTVESLAPLVVKMRASASCSTLKITWKINNNKKEKVNEIIGTHSLPCPCSTHRDQYSTDPPLDPCSVAGPQPLDET